jgi:hypothetical protein
MEKLLLEEYTELLSQKENRCLAIMHGDILDKPHFWRPVDMTDRLYIKD